MPVWVLGTESAKASPAESALVSGAGITAERLAQLREGLASLLDTPLVTLEAYQLPSESSLSGGRLLDAASPLAQHLSSLLQHSAGSLRGAAPQVSTGGETLYRMIVPAKVAAQMGSGVARMMPSSAVAGGVHSGVLGALGLVGQATFVPVAAETAAAGGAAAGGSVAAGAAAAGGAGLVTVAAPLVLLAVATAATVYAEQQRREALERITELLSDVRQAQLDDERDALMASSRALDKATALLLDHGTIGHSLGLDSAVHIIDKAVEAAMRRAEDWQRKLASFGEFVSVTQLKKAYPGIDQPAGEFRAQLRMAALAIAMKRRVAILQAIEHAQQSPDLTLPRFTALLASEQQTVDALEVELKALLDALARIKLRPSDRTLDTLVTRGEVRDLLSWSPRLRELAEAETTAVSGPAADVEVAMVRQEDGKVRVLALGPAA